MKTGMRGAIAVAVLAFGVAGCTGGDDGSDQEATSDPCYDLECETTVVAGEVIEADGTGGIRRVAFRQISPDHIKIVLYGPDGETACESLGNPLENCEAPPVSIDLEDVDGNMAKVSITS